jgi:DUF4097 and DUF4098 domain-containing protein YvlB
MRTETFHTPGDVLLRVRVPAGRVDIETVDGEETRIEIESEPEVESAAVVEAHGGEVVVEIEERRVLFFRTASEARVRVTCPHGLRMALKCVSANLTVRGKTGAVDVQNVSGNTEFERVDDNLEAQSVSGNVTVKAVAGSTAVETVSGSIRVDQAGGSVTARSVSGNQRFGSLTEGSVTLKSVSGDLRVGIRHGTRLWMDVKSLSGDTSSELPVGEAPLDGDGPLVELRANSTSGSIRITRA